MSIFKVTYDFKFEDWGWTETYYNEYTDITSSLESARTIGLLRKNMLGGLVDGPRASIDTIRVSDVGIQRDALQEKIFEADGTRTNNGSCDNPNLAVAVRCEATAIYRRTLYLSGNPDKICTSGKFLFDIEWNAAFQQFAAALIARPWGIWAILKGTPVIRILNIEKAAGVTTIHTVDDHGLNVGDRVAIQSCPGIQNLRGQRTVLQRLSGTSYTIARTVTGDYIAGGKQQKILYGLQHFTRLQIDGITRRPRGRPSDGPVGRRRRRVRA